LPRAGGWRPGEQSGGNTLSLIDSHPIRDHNGRRHVLAWMAFRCALAAGK
jgi:hypothetical protein